jgi:hypothetical protein
MAPLAVGEAAMRLPSSLLHPNKDAEGMYLAGALDQPNPDVGARLRMGHRRPH